MKRIFLLTIFSVLLFIGCSEQNDNQAEEQQILIEWYESILIMAQTESCVDATNWGITAIGAKACGGPTGYIAYSLNIDTEYFLSQVAEYTAAQNTFNIKWGILSDCMVPIMPSGVECIDGNLYFTD